MEATSEGMSNKVTINGFLAEKRNVCGVWQIMEKCVTISSRNQDINESFQFMMCVFNEDKPLKTSMIYPYFLN